MNAAPAITRPIAISGDLGSGKSTVGRLLAAELGLRFLSTGEIHRSIAAKQQISTLQLNRLAETDSTIDDEVDSALIKLNTSGEALVVDSRMAWWFISNAVSVHLTVDPRVGGTRAYGRHDQPSEQYATAQEAIESTKSRAQSEQLRFWSLYGVRVERLRNYDVVIDSTSATPREIVDCILGFLLSTDKRDTSTKPILLAIDPKRVYPTELVTTLRNLDKELMTILADPKHLQGHPIPVCYSYPYFAALDGHKRLSSAIELGVNLVPAVLEGEGDELLFDMMTANDQLRRIAANLHQVWDWAGAHEIDLPAPDLMD